MIFLISGLIHIFTLGKAGHMEDPGGANPGKCCICGKDISEDE